jgi:hypothetical protein
MSATRTGGTDSMSWTNRKQQLEIVMDVYYYLLLCLFGVISQGYCIYEKQSIGKGFKQSDITS